jgi:PAS domain S-box-containing protein
MNNTEKSSYQLKYETLLENISEGLVIQNMSGQIISFNKAALEILALTENEILGRTSADPRWMAVTEEGEDFPGESHPAMVCLKTGKPVRGVVMGLQFKTGHIKWIKINSSPIVVDSERLCLTTFADITEQKLRSEILANAQSIAKIGSWRFDLKTKELTWTSEHYKIFEIPEPQKSQDLFKMYADRIHPDDHPRMNLVLERALTHGEDFVYNHRVYFDGGKRIKYVQGIGKVSKSSAGNAICVTGTCQDLTDLVSLQEQNRFILDAMGIGIWKFNPVTQDLHWDKSMYLLYELDEAKFNGHYQAWESSLSPEAKAEAVKELGLALSGEKEFNTTFEIITPSKKRKQIGGRGTVVRNDKGEPLMMYGINWDKTKEVMMEASLQQERAKALHNSKLASLGEMSAGVAHEINNPLAIIVGNIPLLNKYKDIPDKFLSKLEAVTKATARIEKIVKGLSKFSRSTGAQEYKIENLADLVTESMVLTDLKSKRHSTPVSVELDKTVQIFCDGVEIEQVLVNLINNAIDAVKDLNDRWVKVSVSMIGENPILRVQDSGGGISEDTENKMFQPFFTTKNVGEGTGLGLSITKGILDQHKANIFINREFKNTCIEVRFQNIKKSGVKAS